MSIDLDVFMERKRLPSFSRLQDAIAAHGFPLIFPEPVRLDIHTGWLPALFQGEESGFEFQVCDLAYGEVQEEAGKKTDAIASFSFHQPQEAVAAMAAAATLAELSDGILSDPQSGERWQGVAAIQEAKNAVDHFVREKAREAVRHPELLGPAEWARAFEATLQKVHPDYRLNEEYRGTLVECQREDATGLILSQSCVKMGKTYRHCFGVLLTKAPLSGRLQTPFLLGSRFDHNHTISKAYFDDYCQRLGRGPCPKEWHSEHRTTLRSAAEFVEPCARSAEKCLRPVYLAQVSDGADRLSGFFRRAAEILGEWGANASELARPVVEGQLSRAFASEYRLETAPEDWDRRLVAWFNGYRLAEQHGVPAEELLAHRGRASNLACRDIAQETGWFSSVPGRIRTEAAVVAQLEDFLSARADLPRIISVIEALRGKRPQIPEPKRPWWKLW